MENRGCEREVLDRNMSGDAPFLEAALERYRDDIRRRDEAMINVLIELAVVLLFV